jgi:hypothetical protein
MAFYLQSKRIPRAFHQMTASKNKAASTNLNHISNTQSARYCIKLFEVDKGQYLSIVGHCMRRILRSKKATAMQTF